jgi:hypothetical protein
MAEPATVSAVAGSRGISIAEPCSQLRRRRRGPSSHAAPLQGLVLKSVLGTWLTFPPATILAPLRLGTTAAAVRALDYADGNDCDRGNESACIIFASSGFTGRFDSTAKTAPTDRTY